ncbi:MAG TPA: YlxM family DNA-binding protein [Candidatus Gallacutalibacter pullicola]|uniref:UPF0122 protein IAA54_04360 n=1 Tax=Candidatus Gallacutalibacter pullicola TaxID=2840830 RepID=A0A9D1DPW6_9FIRM|nr:YlxM family DNA-binding protein [Candidatus Gallacutalibacter pullicola]
MAKNLHISYLLDFYSGLLTEKQREVMNYYYNDDLSLGEIAANEGITRQGVRDSIKRAETQLLELESQLGLVRRFREIHSGLEQICDAAVRIQEYNNQYIYSNEIQKDVNTILQTAQQLFDEEEQ